MFDRVRYNPETGEWSCRVDPHYSIVTRDKAELERILDALEAYQPPQTPVRNPWAILILAVACLLPGCALGRTEFVASWQPEPDVTVQYAWTLGPASTACVRQEAQDERGAVR
jgi:hypothetical protein